MKHTFKVGDKVRVLAPSHLDPEHHNKNAVVVAVEPEGYTGGLPVAVQIKGVEPEIWLRLDDLAPREKKPFNVGDRVIVKVQPGRNMFPVGTDGVVTWIRGSTYTVEADGYSWCYDRDSIKRVKAPTEAAEAPAWPWPAGTLVRLLPGHGEVYTLWHDGTDIPPVMDGDVFVCYVAENQVERAE